MPSSKQYIYILLMVSDLSYLPSLSVKYLAVASHRVYRLKGERNQLHDGASATAMALGHHLRFQLLVRCGVLCSLNITNDTLDDSGANVDDSTSHLCFGLLLLLLGSRRLLFTVRFVFSSRVDW